MKIKALFAGIVLFAAFGFAADFKSYMEIYKQQLYDIIQRHATDIEGLNKGYQQSLSALLSQVKKEGNLDKTQTVLAEIERFAKAQAIPSQHSPLSDIRDIQALYAKRMAALELDKAKRIVALTTQYDSALERLEKNSVASEKLEEAQVIRTERGKAKQGDLFLQATTALADTATPSSAAPALKEPAAINPPVRGAPSPNRGAPSPNTPSSPVTDRKRELPAATDVTTPELKRIPPPKEATESALRRYIRAVLTYSPYQLGGRNDIGSREQRNMLLDLGEGNLDLLLSEGTRMQDRSKSFLITDVAKSLATEDDKDMILKAFKTDIYFAAVVEAKGWGNDAARMLEYHLKNYSLMMNGYGSSEIAFFRLCYKCEDGGVRKALIALMSDPRFTILDGITMNIGVPPPPEVLQASWSRRDKKNVSISLAVHMLALGNKEALEIVGKYLTTFRENRDPREEHLARRAVTAVTRITDAPLGSANEVGQWIQKHISAITWDPATTRFITRGEP